MESNQIDALIGEDPARIREELSVEDQFAVAKLMLEVEQLSKSGAYRLIEGLLLRQYQMENTYARLYEQSWGL